MNNELKISPVKNPKSEAIFTVMLDKIRYENEQLNKVLNNIDSKLRNIHYWNDGEPELKSEAALKRPETFTNMMWNEIETLQASRDFLERIANNLNDL